MKRLPGIIISLLTLLITGCSDDAPTKRPVVFDLVKLDSVTEGSVKFSLQKPDAEAPVILTSTQGVDTSKVPVGDRLIIAYRYKEQGTSPYTSGEIDLVDYGMINNDVLKEAEEEDLEGWDTNPVYLLSAWLTGPYLNMQLMLPYDKRPRRFGLGRDMQSADPAHPDLYLVHVLESDLPTFDRNYYASFDISALKADPAIDGFTLHIADSNLKIGKIDFNF